MEELSGEIGNYKPSDNFGAPWHIDDFIHIQDIWPTYTGAGVRVGVYDNGVQYTHSDLNDNYDFSLHVVFSGFVQDPSDVVNSGPGGADKPHGTAVAGLIAAEANNVGVAGVAYNATLTGVLAYDFEYLGYSGQTALDYVQQAMAWAQNFDVSNHSYGFAVPFGDEAFISFGGGMNLGIFPFTTAMSRNRLSTPPDRPAWKRRPSRTQRPWEHLRRLRRQRPSGLIH